MKTYDWKISGDKYYYFETHTGKIVGSAYKLALLDIWGSNVYTGRQSHTIDDEKILGQYIDVDHARQAVAMYWEIERRTLLAGPEP